GEDLDLLVTYESADGSIQTVSAGKLKDGSLSAELPGVARVMSLAFEEPAAVKIETTTQIGLSDVTVGTTPLSITEWEAVQWRGSGGDLATSGTGVVARIIPGA